MGKMHIDLVVKSPTREGEEGYRYMCVCEYVCVCVYALLA